MIAVLLHEMAHAVTNDFHGPRFRAEVERLIGLGAPVDPMDASGEWVPVLTRGLVKNTASDALAALPGLTLPRFLRVFAHDYAGLSEAATLRRYPWVRRAFRDAKAEYDDMRRAQEEAGSHANAEGRRIKARCAAVGPRPLLEAGMVAKQFVYVCAGLLCLSASTAYAQPPAYITQWGTEGSGNGQFELPNGVAVDASGNVYVADTNNSRIQKFTSSGSYLTQWSANNPTAVAVDTSGNVYVTADYYRVRKFTSSGTLLTQWGVPGTGIGQIQYAVGLALSPSGNVYVTDVQTSRVQVYTGSGTYLTQWGFTDPWGAAVDPSGNVYVADDIQVAQFSSAGSFLRFFGHFGFGNGGLQYPKGVAVDASYNVYVADSQNHVVQKFAGDGTFLTQWGGFGGGNGQFRWPWGVALDASYNVYVADWGNHRIQKFGPVITPTAHQTWGGVKARYRSEGTAKQAQDK